MDRQTDIMLVDTYLFHGPYTGQFELVPTLKNLRDFFSVLLPSCLC